MDRRNAVQGIFFCGRSVSVWVSCFRFTYFTRHCSNLGGGRYPMSTRERANTALILHRSDLQLAWYTHKYAHLLKCSQKNSSWNFLCLYNGNLNTNVSCKAKAVSLLYVKVLTKIEVRGCVCVCVCVWVGGWNHGKLGPNSVGKFKKLIKWWIFKCSPYSNKTRRNSEMSVFVNGMEKHWGEGAALPGQCAQAGVQCAAGLVYVSLRAAVRCVWGWLWPCRPLFPSVFSFFWDIKQPSCFPPPSPRFCPFLLVLNPDPIYEAFLCGCVTWFEAERGSERRFVFAGFCVLLCAHISQLASQLDLSLASQALSVMRGLP